MTKADAYKFMRSGMEVYHKSQPARKFYMNPFLSGVIMVRLVECGKLLSCHDVISWHELPHQGWEYSMRHMAKGGV